MTKLATNAPSATSTGSRLRRSAALDAHTVQDWLRAADGPRLLDVRSPAEFTTAHIPGSYNVPLDLLREHRDELETHLGDDVVLVCRSGARASQAETVLATNGLENLHVLTGGFIDWDAAGGPLTRGGQTGGTRAPTGAGGNAASASSRQSSSSRPSLPHAATTAA